MSDVCSRPTDVEREFVGGSCPECGHTNIVHPGQQNPSLVECVICVLQDFMQQPLPKEIVEVGAIEVAKDGLPMRIDVVMSDGRIITRATTA